MNIRTIKVQIRIMVEPDEDRFHAYCPDLRGLHVDGTSENEAVKHAKDAALAYLMSLIKHDDPIPIGVLKSDETKSILRIIKESVTRRATKARSHIEELSLAA